MEARSAIREVTDALGKINNTLGDMQSELVTIAIRTGN